ncbi:disease resistance protein RPM1-like isoform X1 [Zingiber officinale]|nr:disease resistance protein RPM1-like isoform X1 [Zingiber officinale]
MMTRSSGKSIEEEADDYLAELVDRSMLQVVKRNGFGRLKAFRMHDVVREVTLAISRKAKFCMILDGSQSVLDNQTRRVSIQTNDESLDLSTSLSRLCSLIAFSTSKFRNRAALISFKMLRVLELERVRIYSLSNEVTTLFNLHYLGLRQTGVQQFPNNIQKLQSLQTLDLCGARIRKLPRGVTQLKQLRHLFGTWIEVVFGGSTIPGCVPTLEGSWQCKNLQTLKEVFVTEKLVQRLGDMKELRTLAAIGVDRTNCPQICTSLTKMRNLRCLRLNLFGNEDQEQLNFEMLNSPPPLLQKLDLDFNSVRLFEGKMPAFICSCTELTHVSLSGSHLIEDPLPSLGQLHKLVALTLRYDAYEGQKLHFRTGWFLNLKRLYLEGLKNLNNIVIEEGAMASLYKLYMEDLPELKMVPSGIEFLTHLQKLTLCSMSEELEEKLSEDDANEEERRRIRHIPIVTIE